VTIYMDLRPAGLSDDLKDTLDYAAAYAAVRGVVESARGRPAVAAAKARGSGGNSTSNGPFALVERVAQRCADALLAMDGRVWAVRVGVRKPHVAVEGVLESLGVEVLRRRQQGAGAGGGAGGPARAGGADVAPGGGRAVRDFFSRALKHRARCVALYSL
jgi:dihydroneopterin aldolase